MALQQEEDGPEAALAKLLAAASGANESAWTMGTSAHSQSLQLLPSEQQLQVKKDDSCLAAAQDVSYSKVSVCVLLSSCSNLVLVAHLKAYVT